MANIGITKASYIADTSISKLNRDVGNSVEKLSKAKERIADGDLASLASMENTFKLEVVSASAAIQSMSVTQAYLSTAISTLDNASEILKEIHALAVMGANGSNSDEDNKLINMEAEALADTFHKAMTAAQYKGKPIFTDDPNTSVLSAGGRSNYMNFGVGKVDYDLFYDYTNPQLTSLDAGVTYEITRNLSPEEKALILARSPEMSESMLVPGLQFTTPPADANIGEGSIEVLDDSGNVVAYQNGQAPLRIDPTANASVEGDFRGGSLDIEVSKNFEVGDLLTIKETDDILIDDNNVLTYKFMSVDDQGNDVEVSVEVGQIDETKDGTTGKLQINIFDDATTPGTGKLLNGNFEGGTRTEYTGIRDIIQTGVEHRDGMIETYNITSGGAGYVDAGDQFSTNQARGSNTYSINFDSTKADGSQGTGTGFRANVRVTNGSLSIVEVLDKGKNYEVGDILTISAEEYDRGNGTVARPTELLQGNGFSMTVATISNANDEDPFPASRNDNNVHQVSTPNFNQVSVRLQHTDPETYASWGERFVAGEAVREINNGGTLTDILHQQGTSGNYADPNSQPVLHQDLIDSGVTTAVWTDVYDLGDDGVLTYDVDGNITDQLIVNYNPEFAAGENLLEQISVANGNDNSDQRVFVGNLVDGDTVTTFNSWEDWNAAESGNQFVDVRNYGNWERNVDKDVAEAEMAANPGKYDYDANYNVQIVPEGTNGANRVIATHNAGGVYDWGGGRYEAGDQVKVQVNDPNAREGFTLRRHTDPNGGTYDWAIPDGTNFNPADLNWAGGDVVLEFGLLGDGDVAPAGATVYVTNAGQENEKDAFYTVEAGPEINWAYQTSHYEKNTLIDYDRRLVESVTRREIAFYTREKQIRTAEASGGTAQVYTGYGNETIDNNASAHVGYEYTGSQVFINNWTSYDGRVEFGSTFTIRDTNNGEAIIHDLSTGQYDDTAVVPDREIITPSIEEMALPDYGDFIRIDNGQPGNPNVQNKDDAVTAPIVGNPDFSDPNTPNDDVALINNVTKGVAGKAMELFTGEIEFAEQAAFGIYHGPAVVSDQFEAEAGQFLRLNYTAQGDVDNYHVAGYIYEVEADENDPNYGNAVRDENGDPKIVMALSETGKTILDGRASVEIEEAGDYRFVFIVGTFDKTGGKAAGASMTIDNIVAEFPYNISEDAVTAMLQAVHYENGNDAATGTKTITSTLRNSDDSHLLTDDAVIRMEGFTLTNETDGPFIIAPSLNLVTTPSEGAVDDANILTSKIEEVQQRLNAARVQAGSQYAALQEAIASTTDLRSQLALGSGTLSDLNFSMETAHLSRRQMQQDVATAMLAQANKVQTGLVSLIDGSYRTYLNAQFSHLNS